MERDEGSGGGGGGDPCPGNMRAGRGPPSRRRDVRLRGRTQRRRTRRARARVPPGATAHVPRRHAGRGDRGLPFRAQHVVKAGSARGLPSRQDDRRRRAPADAATCWRTRRAGRDTHGCACRRGLRRTCHDVTRVEENRGHSSRLTQALKEHSAASGRAEPCSTKVCKRECVLLKDTQLSHSHIITQTLRIRHRRWR